MSQITTQSESLGEQHFVTVQMVGHDRQFVCVKCGLRAYLQELILGGDCKSTLELQEPETKSYLTMCREAGYDD